VKPLANKADTARIRSEVDIVVPFRLSMQIGPASRLSKPGVLSD
jgi:hypothetical protein